MRVANGTSGRVEIIPGEGDSAELLAIAGTYMPEWLRLFAKKNADYGSGSAFELGERGQYSDIHRKMIKLKRAMWDGEELDFESTDEIISDLIGHLFLTLHMRAMKEEANRVYAYSEDDAAVDAIFRMVGGDASKAYQLSYGLTPPFGDMVRARASKQMEDDAREEMAARCSDPSLSLEEATQRLRDAGMTNDRDEPLLMSRGKLLQNRIADAFASMSSSEFGEADQAQHVPLKVGDKLTISGSLEMDGDYLVARGGVTDISVVKACTCHDNEGNSLLPKRDDDPVHPQDPDEDEMDEAIREEEAAERDPLLASLGELVDGVTDEALKGEAKVILDKIFKKSDQQRALLSRFERIIRGY